jgi:hypothetical protein
MTKKQTPLSKFVSEVANEEGKIKQVSIGNIREVLKIVNKKLDGELYRLINAKNVK